MFEAMMLASGHGTDRLSALFVFLFLIIVGVVIFSLKKLFDKAPDIVVAETQVKNAKDFLKNVLGRMSNDKDN